MKTIIYHHAACSKSCETLSILEEAHEDLTIINYVKNPPSVETLSELIQLLEIKPEDLVRKNEPIYKTQFAHTQFSDAEWLVILANNPILIERPIVIKNGKAIIGRPPKLVQSIL